MSTFTIATTCSVRPWQQTKHPRHAGLSIMTTLASVAAVVDVRTTEAALAGFDIESS